MHRPMRRPLLPAVLTVMLCACRASGAAGLERIDDVAPAQNPGRIDTYRYVPASLRPDPALIVVLHGCGQSAEDFGAAGWFDLAERSGALLLLPQQRRRNSLTRCWNWFV
ncbi:MAG: esterase, partial [Gammaproteobacteria bacterium]|nr:esterase [Gammaproteobacteria bacterium]